MADELNLAALREKILLRETNAHIVGDEEASASYRFILAQIDRVAGCGCKGTGWKRYFQHTIECPCHYLRSDLLKLQRGVLGG